MSKVIVSEQPDAQASLAKYVFGFGSSLVLTAVAFAAVNGRWLPRQALLVLIASLALVQAVIQLRLFLHLGEESKPRYKTAIFAVVLCVILILVFGSLWIMDSLNGRMQLTPAQQEQYLQSQDSL